MEITLQRVNQAVHLEAVAPSSEVHVHIDGSPAIGGEGAGVRPMELVLMALGSCSAFDMLSILKKQRQEVLDFKVDVKGKRRDEIPQIFTQIHLDFYLTGDLDPDKVQKTAELAVKKYCSVHDMLAAGGVDITYALHINAS
jgi:putative redox protein